MRRTKPLVAVVRVVCGFAIRWFPHQTANRTHLPGAAQDSNYAALLLFEYASHLCRPSMRYPQSHRRTSISHRSILVSLHETQTLGGKSNCRYTNFKATRTGARGESWCSPPLSRIAQRVSIPTRPISESWRALVVWYTYIGIRERWRDWRRPKSRDAVRTVEGQKVSKPRDASIFGLQDQARANDEGGSLPGAWGLGPENGNRCKSDNSRVAGLPGACREPPVRCVPLR